MKKQVRIGLLLCVMGANVTSLDARTIFPTLTQVERYVATLPESVETETDWLNPDFSLFHKKQRPGAFRRFLHWFGIGYKEWNPQGFSTLLRSLTKKRELNGLMGDFIQKYLPNPGDHLMIWTDLFGAFHSLVRDLVELRTKGIITDEFKITRPDCLFVFNGNVIDNSPYVLETLTLVMRLLEANPQQVIYTRGNHEDKQEWHAYGLARELKVRAAGLSREVIPLNKKVTQFFNTLPLGLFLPQTTEKEIELVLIANNEYSKVGFDLKKFAGFLEQTKDGQLSSFKLDNKLTSKKPVHLKVIISGEDRSITYHQTVGLMMLGMQREAIRWLVFSSPTSRNRRMYEFFYDAFAELKITDKLSDWTITLYNQDVRKFFGFKKKVAYNLLTGQRIQEGTKKEPISPVPEAKQKIEPAKMIQAVQEPKKPKAKEQKEEEKKEAVPTEKHEVVVGATIDLSKGASVIGQFLKEGLNLAFGQAAQEGGVGSYLPRITIYDDEYTPAKTRVLVLKLLNAGIDIFLDSVGSPTTESYLDLIKDGKVLLLFPYTGSPLFRKPDLKSIINMRVGYIDEGRVLADYAIDTLHTTNAAIFYQNDSFGRGALKGVMDEFKKRGFKNVVEVPYDRNDVSFGPQVKILKDADPDTIFFFAVVPAVREIIRQLGVPFFGGKNLIGMSVYNELFEKYLAEKGLRFVMIRVVPDPNTSQLEIVKEYRDVATKNNKTFNFTSLEAFINAQVFFDVLKRIPPPLTKEKIIKELEGIKNYNFKGIELNFDPNTRQLLHTLWIDNGIGPLIKKDIPLSKPIATKKESVKEKELVKEKPAKEKKSAKKKPAKKEKQKKEKKPVKEEKPTKKEEEPVKEKKPVKEEPAKAEKPAKEKKPVKEDKPAKKAEEPVKEELAKKEEPVTKQKEPVQEESGEKKPLLMGSLLDLSKGGKLQGKAVKSGVQLRIRQERAKGDSLISDVVFVDDEYTPTKTAQEVDKFLKQGIDIMLTPLGSPTLESYLDLLKQGKVLVLFPNTGAPIFRQKDLKYVVHIRPSYKQEGKILTEYAIDTLHATKGVMFYQDDVFGKGLLEGAQEALKKKGITGWLEIPYMRNDVTFAKQVSKIKSYDPDVILFFSTTTAAIGLIRQLGIQNVVGKKFLANSDFGGESFVKFAKEKGLKLIYINVVPNPQLSNLPIVKQFRDAAAQANVSLDPFTLETYIATDFLLDIMKKIKGPITKEKLIAAIENIKNYDYKGLKFNFDPETRTLSNTFWLYNGTPDWKPLELKSD